MRRCVCSQFSDADVVAWSAEDGGSEQKGPDWHELHQVTQQPGCPADSVRILSRNQSFLNMPEAKSR